MKSTAIALAALFASPALFAAGAALAAGGAGAPTQPASQLQVAMTIYAGGITLGKMDMDATLRGADYHVVSNLTTSGVVNAFWQSEIQATSSGKIGAHDFMPALYDSYDTRAAMEALENGCQHKSTTIPVMRNGQWERECHDCGRWVPDTQKAPPP